MPLLLKRQILVTKCNDLADKRLNDVPQKYGSFEKAEQAIREWVVELEKSMVQETLSHYDINTPLVVLDGNVYRQVLRQNKTYTSAVGPVQVERSLYCAEGHCICPLELQAGIIDSSVAS